MAANQEGLLRLSPDCGKQVAGASLCKEREPLLALKPGDAKLIIGLANLES